MQSVAPARTLVGSPGQDQTYMKIENSLIQSYLEGDSYMAKVFGGGMTNARALQVCLPGPSRLGELTWKGASDDREEVERCVTLSSSRCAIGKEAHDSGYNGTEDRPLSVKAQVRSLVSEATDLGNLSQGEPDQTAGHWHGCGTADVPTGYVAGWLPYW